MFSRELAVDLFVNSSAASCMRCVFVAGSTVWYCVCISYQYVFILPCSHHYFKYCKISALALLKMVMHARSGGNLEVMGLMLGKVDGETMIIMDSFALPVEGTETRVNAQAAAYEYMAAYIENAKQVWHWHPLTEETSGLIRNWERMNQTGVSLI